MRKTRNLIMAFCLAGGTLCGTSCTTDMRDAIIGGAYDFLSGTTTDFLSGIVNTWLSGGEQAEAAE